MENTQISLTELLFEYLVKSFDKFTKQGIRPPYLVIGSHKRFNDLHSFLDEAMYLTPIEPRLKRIFKLSTIIIDNWIQKVHDLEYNENPFCFKIRDNQVWVKTSSKTSIEEWDYEGFAKTYHWFEIIKYVNQVNGYISEKIGAQIPKQTGFQTTLQTEKIKPLFTRLIEKGYIAPDTNLRNFTACFDGLPLPDSFARVQWIKRPTKNKKTPAKKALTDLLILMGTPKEQYRDISKLKTFFADYTGNPLIFTQSNFDNSKDFKDNSEYFPELQKIINSL